MKPIWDFLPADGLGLVSRSPRRARILTDAGIPYRVVPSALTDESSDLEPVTARAVAIARAKCEAAVRDAATPRLLFGADTMVVRDGSALGKPAGREDARAMLAALGGSTHEVVTGIAVHDTGSGRWAAGHESTRVTFRALTKLEIDAYLDTDEPWDKAGAYGIQGRAGLFVDGIEGCYFNVVGLPLVRLGKLVQEAVNGSGD